jgi:dTMP kinase
MSWFRPNRYAGKLIAVEGIDGSGKSTQLSLLKRWLRSTGVIVACSECDSSPLAQSAILRGAEARRFTAASYSLLHAADLADRMERYIVPMLKAGSLVLADGYAFRACARDVARGLNRRWVRNLYSFAVRPNATFHLRLPVEIALTRVVGRGGALQHYNFGMDLGLSRSPDESFRLFQGRIQAEYDAMAREMGFHIIDATIPMRDQQQEMRQLVSQLLAGSVRRRSSAASAP